MTAKTPSREASRARSAMSVTPASVIGWREWLALPDLGLPAIKAKVDTGARTSALHAVQIENYRRARQDWVRFIVHPFRRLPDIAVSCRARVCDVRKVMDSGGHVERRYFIRSAIAAGDNCWIIEMSLSNRSTMMFPMLLGRAAMVDMNVVIDPRLSYTLPRPLESSIVPSFKRGEAR